MNYQTLLENDRYSHLLTKSDHFSIIKQAKKAAIQIAKSYNIDRIKKRLKEDKFIIEYVQNNQKGINIKYRAQIIINNKSKKILIYKDTIEQLIEKYGYNFTFFENIYLAHEFFHYLEYCQEIDVRYFIKHQGLFKITRTYQILTASEIAANEFAINVLNLKFNPLKMDFE